ncbi:MAG: hypothetical protein AB7S38_00100 [Vulcanimicrobiota bacterium]
MHISAGATPRTTLQTKLTRMHAELESKGTVDDPVSSQIHWCQDKIQSLDVRLRGYDQPDLQGVYDAATLKGMGHSRKAAILTLATAGAALATGAAAFLLNGNAVAVGAGLVTTLSLGLAGVDQTLRAGEAHQTAQEIQAWGQAFSQAPKTY